MKEATDKILGLTVGEADVDEVKSFASEFNVRKRMVPRLLVFTSRARQASQIKLPADELPTAEMLFYELSHLLNENELDADGRYLKQTLAIGGGGADEL